MNSPLRIFARRFLITACLLGALAVAFGAFGAHGLRHHLASLGRTDTFETAVRYHFYHAFALLALGILLLNIEHRYLIWAGRCLVAGTILFSGSLYTLCINASLSYFGTLTPVGGLFLIAGWLLMLFGVAASLKAAR